MRDKKVYKLALGGICLALSVIFMFGASIAPGVEMTLYAISSLFVAVMIIETGVKGGIMLYVGAVLLGLLLVPDKIDVLPYACLFGLYGIVKYYIEKIKRPAVQVALKAAFFAVIFSIFLIVMRELLLGETRIPDMPTGVLIAAGVLFLLLYDLIYTLLISIYRKRFHRPETISFSLSKRNDDENDRQL